MAGGKSIIRVLQSKTVFQGDMNQLSRVKSEVTDKGYRGAIQTN